MIATKVGRSLIQGQSYDMDRTLQLNSFYELSFMGWVSHPVSSVIVNKVGHEISLISEGIFID